MVAMLEYVATAVYPRPLAIPHPEHTVVLGWPDKVDLLRAPHGGGGHFFIGAGLKLDVLRLEMLLGVPQRLIETAER